FPYTTLFRSRCATWWPSASTASPPASRTPAEASGPREGRLRLRPAAILPGRLVGRPGGGPPIEDGRLQAERVLELHDRIRRAAEPGEGAGQEHVALGILRPQPRR